MIWWHTPPPYVALVGLAGIAVWRMIPQRLSAARLFVQIACFLTMSLLLFDGGVVPYELTAGDEPAANAIVIGLAKILWWVHCAWALIGLVRIYVVFERKPHEARLLQDLVVGVVYVGASLSILAFVFGVPIGALIATSGAFAIVLGLALQNTLSDVFSGIALNLGRPYLLGDWIVLSDGIEGRVVETDWRATHLLTPANNVVALPNSVLAKMGLTNVSSPDETHGLSILVRLAPTKSPAAIVEAMRAVFLSSDSIVKAPPPVVAIKGLDADAIVIELSFRAPNIGQRIAARNDVFDLVYRHAKSAGLHLATQSSSISAASLPNRETWPFTAIELIEGTALFSALTDQEREALAETALVRTYRKGEILVREGEMLQSLMIVRSGVVVRQRGEEAHPQEIGHLAPGDFFGETGLLAGYREPLTLRAVTQVVAYEIDQQSFAPLLLSRPEMAEELAAILSASMSTVEESGLNRQRHPISKSALREAIHTAFRAVPFRRVVGGPDRAQKKRESHGHLAE
ncbi:mechanosensitive ion channel family protein [Mesorhizobium japonicum]|uniref:mechanosensitive ion channel family protein n=1 Tax=Mesorhizobium japonicum TaxID=2066070 RepID=UPI0012FEE544|nr:mechanosensitive ion channel family protein [Mesorhizobium japonicum]